MKLCFRNRGIDLGMWTCRGYTVLPYCCKLSESLTHIDIKCHSAKSLPMVGGAATMIASFAARMVVASDIMPQNGQTSGELPICEVRIT